MEKFIAPPEDKKHSEKGQRSVEELADCPAMKTKRTMQEKEREDQGYVAEERYKYGEEELLFSLKEPGEHTGKDGEQARNEEIAGQGDGQGEALAGKAVSDDADAGRGKDEDEDRDGQENGAPDGKGRVDKAPGSLG